MHLIFLFCKNGPYKSHKTRNIHCTRGIYKITT